MAIHPSIDDPPTGDAPHTWTELDEEQVSQGYKTGHMRWVLAIGLALACVVVGLAAAFHL